MSRVAVLTDSNSGITQAAGSRNPSNAVFY